MKKSFVFPIDRYFSTKDLAKLLHANESSIKRWADSGELKCFKTPGGHRRFTTQNVNEFVKKYQYEFFSISQTFASDKR